MLSRSLRFKIPLVRNVKPRQFTTAIKPTQGMFKNSEPLTDEQMRAKMFAKRPHIDATNIVWVDCEMTGLTDKDVVLEVACAITDAQLNILTKEFNIVLGATEEQLSRMTEIPLKMHTENGLLEAVKNSKITYEEADEALREYIKPFIWERTSPCAGNSVHVDRMFLARQFPLFNSFLSHRNIDVSSLKELAQRWNPEIFQKFPVEQMAGKHRALGDIRNSIKQLKFYKEHFIIPQPTNTFFVKPKPDKRRR
ncbi:oligoribonuclease [Planoprotostelium fungivorum]|uniref:Oligoribonuclease n=1 Tax=Planoprotostelium fungivorum TaxID=1890364 RepID=A0A2P6MNZ7_9EUKA|nr:oligoribonuclease [Planoprotostelium fungivorum]